MRYVRLATMAACLVAGITVDTAVAAPATQPASATAPATQPAPPPRPAKAKLGIAVSDLRNDPNQKGLIEEFGGHLIVQAALPRSRAERMGLKSGDVIRRINGKEVDTVRDVQDAVRETDKLFEIEILRKKEPMTLREQPNVS